MTSPNLLDPLSADELRRVAAVLRGERDLRPSWRFASIELQEPDKRVPRGDPPPRRAVAIGWDRAGGDACKAIVSLDEERVVSWEERPGEQANMTVDEWHECDAALRRDPGVLEALARRGIEPDAVLLDVWNYGAQLIPEPHRGRRIGWTDVWIRGAEGGNPYANPVNGLHFVVDLNTMELLGSRTSSASSGRRVRWASTSRRSCPARYCARTSRPSTSSSPRAPRSCSTGTASPGSGGPCGSASTTARAS